MASTNEFYLSLAAVGSRSQPINVSGTVRASVGITLDAGYSFGLAVVEVEYTIDPDQNNWFSFPTALTMSSSSPAITRIATAGLLALRLRTTTGDGDSDPAARFDVTVTDSSGRTRAVTRA